MLRGIIVNYMQISGNVQYPNMKRGSGSTSVLIILKESLLVSASEQPFRLKICCPAKQLQT